MSDSTIAWLTSWTPTTDDLLVFYDNADWVTKKTPISSLPSSGSGVTIGTTTITSGTSWRILYDNSWVVGELPTSGASSVVLRDTNQNITVNNLFTNSASTVSAGGTTVMTVASARIQNLTWTLAQTFQLPNATTLVLSQLFLFNNNSSQSLTITNNGSVSQYVIPAGWVVEVYCTDISTANGVFDFHPLPPGTVTWWSGVTGLVMNSVLNTTPTVSAGASSSTAPVFIPQRGTLNTWIGWDATNVYWIVWGVARMTVNSAWISTPWILTQNWQTVSEADFYKYRITTSVASGNLTVTLLNYLGNTPSATVPVKWQDGNGVIRTISSALTVTFNSATNYLNLGSAELATKEADLFVLFQWNTTAVTTNLLVTRFPSANTMADITNSNTGEKWAMGIVNYNTTDSVVNIGRFNAILSAGAGYTWSIPATSVIINSPILETRKLSYSATLGGFSTPSVTTGYYKLIGNELHLLSNEFNGTSSTTAFTFTTPFAIGSTFTRFFCTNWYDNGIATANTVVEMTWSSNTHAAFKTFPTGTWTASGFKAIYVPNMIQII